MLVRREELGHQVLYEGLCLALFLAPSLDAFGRRFGAAAYTDTLRNYASYFREIEISCAEEVATRLQEINGNAADAFESLTKDDPGTLTTRIIDRAHWWREADQSI